jgi:protein gp37
MGENTKIEWCDHSWNPWVGCTKISPACDHCYAESWAKRTGHPELWQGNRRRTSAANWKQPIKWNREATERGIRFRVFCASLADVFDNACDDQWRADLFGLIRLTPNLDWQLLTKRIGNVPTMLRVLGDEAMPPNVWLGATVVNQEEADRDIPKLLSVPAAVRFLSMEPLLGPVTLNPWLLSEHGRRHIGAQPGISWVIVGGESGAHARPMNPAWVRSLRDQCAKAQVAFFFKQHGEWVPAPPRGQRDGFPDFNTALGRAGNPPAFFIDEAGNVHCFTSQGQPSETVVVRVGKKRAGRFLDGVTHNGFPR